MLPGGFHSRFKIGPIAFPIDRKFDRADTVTVVTQKSHIFLGDHLAAVCGLEMCFSKRSAVRGQTDGVFDDCHTRTGNLEALDETIESFEPDRYGIVTHSLGSFPVFYDLPPSLFIIYYLLVFVKCTNGGNGLMKS